MIAMAPMLSAVLGAIFLKEMPEAKRGLLFLLHFLLQFIYFMTLYN